MERFEWIYQYISSCFLLVFVQSCHFFFVVKSIYDCKRNPTEFNDFLLLFLKGMLFEGLFFFAINKMHILLETFSVGYCFIICLRIKQFSTIQKEVKIESTIPLKHWHIYFIFNVICWQKNNNTYFETTKKIRLLARYPVFIAAFHKY